MSFNRISRREKIEMIENFGMGIDIVEVNRFKNLDFEKKKEFYKKTFSDDEIKYCLKYKDAYRHFAGKFALKEAVIKSTNLKINLSEIVIENHKGKPIINISKNNSYLFIASISHEKNYAIAIVISERTYSK